MAKTKLNWTKIDLASSDKKLATLREAELKAQEQTNAHIVKLVAANYGVPEYQVRVGRNFGNISFAVDAAAKETAENALVGLKAK